MLYTRRNFFNAARQRLPAPEQCWLHVSRTAMATRFEVTLPPAAEKAVATATAALDEIDRIEGQLTAYRETSELSFVNRHAADRPVKIEQRFFNLLRLCQKIARDTAGAFDITSGPLTRCWGFYQRAGRLPAPDEIEAARSNVGSESLLLDQQTRSIQFAQKGLEINLGSIGKGYALDRVATLMRSNINSALLNAGASSMLAIGRGDHSHGWLIGLRDPRSKTRRAGLLRLKDAALSTSGSGEQFFEFRGKRYGHIIDPRTGWPASQIANVSVIADSAAESDALATAFFVGGRELAEDYCARSARVMAIMFEPESAIPLVIGTHPGCTDLQFSGSGSFARVSTNSR
ncbi:MAG TPA: FAD:protein FMN transferase [Pyrinomonadaceae bacterium]|nr:FAD:protein FMN transferase [Pyrinomonadaceae bacterium]